MLKLQHCLCTYSGTKGFNYANFFLSFSPSSIVINMFPIPFTRTFEFFSPTSILEPAITPTFKQFYPPPILTKHPVWYSLNANFFIALWGTLYGLHWWHFQSSILFQEIIAHGEKHLIGLLPQHPIPCDSLKGGLFNYFLILLYYGSLKLNHINTVSNKTVRVLVTFTKIVLLC